MYFSKCGLQVQHLVLICPHYSSKTALRHHQRSQNPPSLTPIIKVSPLVCVCVPVYWFGSDKPQPSLCAEPAAAAWVHRRTHWSAAGLWLSPTASVWFPIRRHSSVMSNAWPCKLPVETGFTKSLLLKPFILFLQKKEKAKQKTCTRSTEETEERRVDCQHQRHKNTLYYLAYNNIIEAFKHFLHRVKQDSTCKNGILL